MLSCLLSLLFADVVTYHPPRKRLTCIIHRNLYLLYVNQDGKKVFIPGFIMALRNARQMSSVLVRARFYPLERTVDRIIIGIHLHSLPINSFIDFSIYLFTYLVFSLTYLAFWLNFYFTYLPFPFLLS